MSNLEFHPLSAAYLRNFFDADGKPLGAGSKCPTCGHTRAFTLAHSTGRIMQFIGDCGHGFELKTPE